jgi:hypothetical protein
MKKIKADLNLIPDNGQMSLWASGGYVQMSIYDDLFDSEITYNVHPRHLQEINGIVLGDLVMTAEGDTGLVVEQSTRDLQGFVIFKILMQGKEFFYSALELAVIGV